MFCAVLGPSLVTVRRYSKGWPKVAVDGPSLLMERSAAGTTSVVALPVLLAALGSVEVVPTVAALFTVPTAVGRTTRSRSAEDPSARVPTSQVTVRAVGS